MIKVIALVSSLILLKGCAGDSIKTEQKGDFNVELLFEKDGCKMYRFKDDGRYVYWSDCRGATSYEEGKHNNRTDQITTN